MSATELGLHQFNTFVRNGQAAQAAVDKVISGVAGDSRELVAPKARPASLNPTRFLNRSEVREFILETAKTRAHKFTRVSEETLVHINEVVRTACIGVVKRAPSKGKTL